MTTNLVLMKENEKVLELSRKLGFDKTLFLVNFAKLIKSTQSSSKMTLKGNKTNYSKSSLGKDLALVSGNSKKELLKKIKEVKKKNLFVVVKPKTEDLLRFVLEKTSADLVFGQELINQKDSVHFRRGGLDQITCKIARDKGKIIGFSFRDILEANGEERSKILGRMILNIKLCRKYKVKVFFGNFSENELEMRGKQDLEALFEVIGGKGLRNII